MVDPFPNFTESSGLSIITCIIPEIELITVLNSFEGAFKLKNLPQFQILFEFVVVEVSALFFKVIGPTQQYLLENSLAIRLAMKVSLV